MAFSTRTVDPGVAHVRNVAIPSSAGLTASGGFLAPIDYAALARGKGKVDVPIIPSPAMEVTCLTAPAGLSVAMRSACAGVILRGFEPDGAELHRKISWIISVLELLVPNTIATMSLPGLNVVYEDLPLTTANLWAGVATGTPPVAPTEAERLAAPWPVCLAGTWGEAASELSSGEVAALYGALIYCLIKTPSGPNEVSFGPTAGRPLAAARASGRNGPFSAAECPTLDQFRAFGSTLVAAPGLRTVLCRNILIWAYSTNAHPLLRLAGGQARLWRLHGLTGLHMVSELMMGWGHILSECRTLQAPLAAFTKHAQEYANCNDQLKDFLVALEGTQSRVASIYGNYTALVLVAKVVNGGAASMTNFAGGMTIPREVLAELRDLAPHLPNLPPA